MCRYTHGHLIEVNAHSLFSKYFSESGKLVTQLFGKILEFVEDTRAMVFVLIDEVESLTSARRAAVSGNEPSDAIRAVNSLLTHLDALRAHPNAMVLCTSNLPDAVDVAFVDRADIKVRTHAPYACARRPPVWAAPRMRGWSGICMHSMHVSLEAGEGARVQAYIGPPSAGARYQILRSCIVELARSQLLEAASPLPPLHDAAQAAAEAASALPPGAGGGGVAPPPISAGATQGTGSAPFAGSDGRGDSAMHTRDEAADGKGGKEAAENVPEGQRVLRLGAALWCALHPPLQCTCPMHANLGQPSTHRCGRPCVIHACGRACLVSAACMQVDSAQLRRPFWQGPAQAALSRLLAAGRGTGMLCGGVSAHARGGGGAGVPGQGVPTGQHAAVAVLCLQLGLSGCGTYVRLRACAVLR